MESKTHIFPSFLNSWFSNLSRDSSITRWALRCNVKSYSQIIYLSTLFILQILIGNNCRQNGSEPSLEQLPGKRDYVWSVDTIWIQGAFQIAATDVWGSSAKDVWVTAWSDINMGSLWHYDGNGWVNPLSPADIYDGRGSVDLAGVYGFGPQSIWFIGCRIKSFGPGQTITNGFVMEWTGSSFIEYTDTLITRGAYLQTVGGTSRNNLFVAGLDGIVLHFNGSNWDKVNIDSNVWFNAISATSINSIYFLGYELDKFQPFDSTYYSIYLWDGNNFNLKSRFLQTYTDEHQWGVNFLLSIENKLYSVGYGVFEFINNHWEKKVESVWALRKIRGSSTNNIFSVGSSNTIFHFNGSDWARLNVFSDNSLNWNGIYPTGSEVFLVGTNGSYSIILKGK